MRLHHLQHEGGRRCQQGRGSSEDDVDDARSRFRQFRQRNVFARFGGTTRGGEPLEDGATAGGALRLGWIGVGLKMELGVSGDTIVTSPVLSITVTRRVPEEHAAAGSTLALPHPPSNN